ncbi:MAG: Gfo/Idh/MocA family protein [Brevinematia bacterium]
MEKLKIGVLGVSQHFIKRVLPAIKDSSIISIEAVASRDIEKAKSVATAWGIERYFDSYEKLLESHVDVVYIPLPNHLHLEWIKKSAAKGKHIICEKPLCLDTKGVEEVIEISEKAKVLVMEAFMYRFHPQWVRVKELIKTGEIGKIMTIHSFFGYFNLNPEDIRNKLEAGGGAIRDIGCYPISVSRFLSDREPERVISLIRRDKNFKVDCLASAILDFGDFNSVFTVSTQSVNEQKVYVYGNSGVIEVLLPFNAYTDVPMSVRVKTSLGVRKISFEVADQYKLEFEEFAMAVLENRKPPISLFDSLANQKVIDALFLSEEVKGWADIK